ncbi:MAG: ATP-binding protein [Bacteroidota bacterium]
MFYHKFSFQVVVRIVFLFTTLFILTTIFGDNALFFNQVILCIIITIQVFDLLYYINRTNRELEKFLLAIKHADYTVNFTSHKLGKTFKSLDQSFDQIITSYKQVKIEKEAQFQFLEIIVAQIGIGIISVKKDKEIVLMNEAAGRLLEVPKLKNWEHLKQKNVRFAKAVSIIQEGGNKLLEYSDRKGIRSLAINVMPIYLIDEPYILITLQDINTEIEQKELEAWNKLIRILTHEIMNSLTPVSSLTETILMLLEDEKGNTKKVTALGDQQIEDIYFSLQTILRRSEGMLHFVEDYRKLTRLPIPKKDRLQISLLFKSVKKLLEADMQKYAVNLSIDIAADINEIFADQHLIEQLLINLIKNAIHALNNTIKPKIILKAFNRENEKVLQVIDNGMGIDTDKLNKIFIPFYSTKEEGSGIGLSLSRNIMNLHNGTLKVYSEKGKGSIFSMIFR